MSINYLIEKIKQKRSEIFISLVIILVAFSSYGLGKLSVLKSGNEDITISHEELNGEVYYVASKSGSKYYYPWCGGAGKILDKNKVIFNTVNEAEGAGYEPSSSCFGQ